MTDSAHLGALTDDYDASASSAGEMSLPAGSTGTGTTSHTSHTSYVTLPPRRVDGTGGYRAKGTRRERERSSRRAAAAKGGGGSAQGIADAVKSMGLPPSILIPLPASTSADDSEDSRSDECGDNTLTMQQQNSGGGGGAKRAAAVPTALLPPGNAHWDATSVCGACLNLSDDLRLAGKPIVVLLLRSGRFAGGVFQGDRCVIHRACARYTVRRGQGGAQSSMDSSKGKAKSMGAQLRRAGEQGLREDVASTLKEWKSYIENAALVLLSCPKTMRKGLHEEGDTAKFLARDDGRIRRVPLDVGRPTYESVSAVYQIMLSVTIRPITEQERHVMESTSYDLSTEAEADGETPAGAVRTSGKDDSGSSTAAEVQAKAKAKAEAEEASKRAIIPLTPLHEAAAVADLVKLSEMLSLNEEAAGDDAVGGGDMIDARAGEDLQTPLHLAAAHADPIRAAECVSALLVQGKANPCVVDARNRPPYFVADHEKVRDAFHSARAVLGEDHCDWADAKVPAALTQDDIQRKKEKAAEKKRRQCARQKEKKAAERAAEEARLQKEKEEAAARKQEEDAKRIRAV